MSGNNFTIPGYDAWKTRAPEDEPGYWDGKEPPDDNDEESAGLENAMNLKEAYAAIDAVVSPNQAVFISTQCRWHDRREGPPRKLTIEFQVSLVPGFASTCDQWTSVVSLQTAVDKCLAAAAEAVAPPATLTAVDNIVAEASVNAQALELVDDDIPY